MSLQENGKLFKNKLNSKKNNLRLILSLIVSNLLSFLTGINLSADNGATDRIPNTDPLPHKALRAKHALITLPVAKYGAVAQFIPAAKGVEVVVQAPGGKILSIASFLVHLEKFDDSSMTAYLEIPESDFSKFTLSDQLNLYFLWPSRKNLTPIAQETIHEIHF
jgi:hypothetical protein